MLFVSTGNVCRSPLAERIAEQQLTRALGIEADLFRWASAGTWGHDGAPMEPNARTVLHERGAREEGFVARELVHEHVVLADLVLTGSREQCGQVRLFDGHAARRAFSMREFARLARQVRPGSLPGSATARARGLVERVADLRDRAGQSRSSDDIADPYGAPLHVFRLCAQEITECVGTFVAHVANSDGGRMREELLG
ncbi:MAG: arsenate reductase/protein-tyrosine-phosphatase family protein [Sporichthyaceae bacterium]